MNMRPNISPAAATPLTRTTDETYYRGLFWRTERMLVALDLKMKSQAAIIDEAKYAWITSGGEDNARWNAAYAVFDKYQQQFSRLHRYALRLAVAVAREGAPA